MLKSYIIFINKPQVLKGAFKQLQNPHQHVTSSVFNTVEMEKELL